MKQVYVSTVSMQRRLTASSRTISEPNILSKLPRRCFNTPRRHDSSATTIQSDASVAKPPSSTEALLPLRPLSCLPLSTLLRSYLVTSISSQPVLLRPALGILSFIAHSKSPLLNPDQNPVIRFLLKKTLYAQFCAGETPTEIQGTVNALKDMGYPSIILAYAKEVVMDENEAKALGRATESSIDSLGEIASWENGNIETIKLSNDGDYVGLKFSGAGRQALERLKADRPPSPELEASIVRLCEAAKARNVRLLFDAEQQAIQKGIDSWTLNFMRRYNRNGRAIVYGTYQAYLKATPSVLATHLEHAKRENFTTGVKLVRGAYLGSDPRDRIWETKAQTDTAYNEIAEALIRTKYAGILKAPEHSDGTFPNVYLVLAGHNSESVSKARTIRDNQVRLGEPRIDMVYGQLMGMADNISCSLVQAGNRVRDANMADKVDIPRAVKYLVWGSVGECTKYLLRRAEENRDAVSRTEESRRALGLELKHRAGIAR